MTWSDEVHTSRYQAAIALASAERKRRKRGLPVPVIETAQMGPLMAMVAVASGLVAWQQWGAQVRATLAQNPLVQQFRSLILGSSSSAPRPSGTKSGAAGGKVRARMPVTAGSTPAQAATAAAEARLAATATPTGMQATARAVPPVTSRPAETESQPQASTSASSGSGQQGAWAAGSGAGKKKKGKKRR